MNMLSIIKGSLVLVSLSTPCYAATINYLDLPLEIRQMSANSNSYYYINDISISGVSDWDEQSQQDLVFESEADSSIFSEFNFDYSALGNYEHTKLIRYNLNFPSEWSHRNFSDDTEVGLAGYRWLEAPSKINLEGNNVFTIFDAGVLNYHPSRSFDLTYAAAKGGAGFIDFHNPFYYDLVGLPVPPSSGNMTGISRICPECGYEATLNLVGFSYDHNGDFTINAADFRAHLFSEVINDGPKVSKTDLYVQPVPLPAAAWLFSSSLFVFWYRIKRAKKMSA